MNCRESQLVLEEYVDGELDQSSTDAVTRHLEKCLTCTTAANELRAELALYQNYNNGIEAPQNLWVGVQSRLEMVESPDLVSGPTRNWLAGLMAKPGVNLPVTVALILVAVVITVVIMKRPGPTQPGTVVSSGVNAQVAKNTDSSNNRNELAAPFKAPEPKSELPQKRQSPMTGRNVRASSVAAKLETGSADQLVREAQKKYLTAISILSRDVARGQSKLDPDTRAKLEQALASIDRAIAATRLAVREHPNDPVAVQFMLSAYAKKVDVLREIATAGDF